MTTPAWIERIKDDPSALASFNQYLDEQEGELLQKMRDCLEGNELDKARVFGGESNAYKKLRHQIKMYQREEEQQNGIIQER